MAVQKLQLQVESWLSSFEKLESSCGLMCVSTKRVVVVVVVNRFVGNEGGACAFETRFGSFPDNSFSFFLPFFYSMDLSSEKTFLNRKLSSEMERSEQTIMKQSLKSFKVMSSLLFKPRLTEK